MEHENKKLGIGMMVIAGFLWGVMGISSRYLTNIHLAIFDVTFSRCLLTAAALSFLFAVTDRAAFKISRRGFLFCAFYGVLNYAFGLSLYSLSIQRIPIAVATILMFSNPIWVSIFNKIFFKEKIGIKRLVCIAWCIFGCMCMINIFSVGAGSLDVIGIAAGVLNGLTFALQIVLPRFVEGKIKRNTILLYGFWSAAIGLFFFASPLRIIAGLTDSSAPLFYTFHLLAAGLLCTFGANTLYLTSTKFIGTGLPSMMVSFEPIFAGVFAFFVFGEIMQPIQLLGGLIVLISVIFSEMNMSVLKKPSAVEKLQ